ncbi:MAG: hypothetical protein E7402_04090 [Ruminococcaceae bacterium]|nr:hypothetical protein [Oscillospiraceae bacterium]
MNWGRAKSILIVLFLITDVFLSFVLVQGRQAQNSLSKEAISATVRVLNNHEIYVTEDVIPRTRTANRHVVLQNFFASPEEAAVIMLGTYTVLEANEEVHAYQYKNEEALLQITDAGFNYLCSREHVPYKLEKEPSNKDMWDKVSSQLEELGFKREETAVENERWEQGLYHADVVPVFEDMKLYGISMKLIADSHGILSLEGAWFHEAEAEKSDEALLDLTAVLTAMIYRDDCRNLRIASIDTGFYIAGDYLTSRAITAIPVYVIHDTDDGVMFFDARAGQLLARR